MELTILGDEALWIQSVTRYLKKGRCVIVGFHVAKYLRQIAGTEALQTLYDALLANDREQFCRKLNKRYGTVRIGERRFEEVNNTS